MKINLTKTATTDRNLKQRASDLRFAERYVASDGTVFSDWSECREYQRELNGNNWR